MILLSKSYRGYLAGTIAQFPTSIEAALIAQGYGVTSAGPVTPGSVATDMSSGRVGIAAAGTSAVVTNPNITTESKIVATLSNSTIDTTAKAVQVTPAAGSVTFTVAAATAAIAIDWVLMTISGELPPN
jgi:hypothetical protein